MEAPGMQTLEIINHLTAVGESLAKGVSNPSISSNAKQIEKAFRKYLPSIVESLDRLGAILTNNQKARLLVVLLTSPGSESAVNDVFNEADVTREGIPTEFDDQWFQVFVDGAKNAFSGWRKQAYSKVLCAEIIDPSSISVLTLSNMLRMGDKDIKSFVTLCSMSYTSDTGDASRPLIFFLNDDSLKTFKLSVRQLRLLKELGLINISEHPKIILDQQNEESRRRINPGVYVKGVEVMFHFGGEADRGTEMVFTKPQLWKDGRTQRGVNLGHIDFTESGRELANALRIEVNPKLKSYIKNSFTTISRNAKAKNKRKRR